MTAASQHIGIAGAGLLGRLLAWRLAAAGHRVTVFDPAAQAADRSPPHAAGWTAAGMLSPIAELESADLRTAERGWRSLDLWAQWLPQLPQPVDFRREGSLLLAHRSDAGSAQRLLAVLQGKLAAGLAPQPLDAAALRALEPAVHGPSLGWLLPGEGQVHSVQAMQALAAGATLHGAQWRWGTAVQRVAPGRLDGERFHHVFEVRGLGARPDLPVRGVRGELLWLHARGLVLHRPLRLLHPRWRVYLVPRPDDIVLVGATEIESEDRSPISVRSTLGLLSAAHSVLPELAEARIVHTDTNLRPALPDNLPRIDTVPGLTRINGLFRHGWLLAPALVEEALAAALPGAAGRAAKEAA
ncbi:FAD-dependent oxidoreductase [Aquincola sp. MAHUQ-54]|uniref:FAD-dependent oxidoreductase n=1 Tax=Aquincola agrisoli TaxID=3119538 RepID=A0AAW9QS42_9BURK